MNLRELSEYTGTPQRTVDRWASVHGMPVTRRRPMRIDRHDFLSWACRRFFVRDDVKAPDAVRELRVYEKAMLWDLSTGVLA